MQFFCTVSTKSDIICLVESSKASFATDVNLVLIRYNALFYAKCRKSRGHYSLHIYEVYVALSAQ